MSKKSHPDRNTDLALSTYIKLVRAAESVTVRTHRHLLSEKLSFGQFAVLEVLYNLAPLCQKDIAAKILKSPRNITMILDNLEKRGLVKRERDAGDRRSFHVNMTESGRSLFERIFPRHARLMRAEMMILTQSEKEELGRLCRIVGKQTR